MKNYLIKKFDIENLETSISTEIFAGISLYLSLAYIFIVNPAILSQAGFPVSAVFFATVICAFAATLAMGVWARLPFALAPGLESNGFVAIVVVGSLGFTWQESLGLVFWSGLLCMLFTVFPVRQKIIDSIPRGLKSSIAVMVGVFVAIIGLVITDVIAFDAGMISGAGDLSSNKWILLLIGLIITAVLNLPKLKFSGAMLVAIIVCTVLSKVLGMPSDSANASFSEFFDAFGQLSLFSVFNNPQAWTVMLVLFMIDFYGSISKFIGLTDGTKLQEPNGKVRHMKEALYVDGLATMGGAVVGTTTMITYVESAVGIAAGGRTGLVAITCAVLMLGSLAFTPLIGVVPVAATGGVLVYVGWLLLPRKRFLEGELSKFDIFTGLLMGVVTLLTFSLDKSLLLGFLLYAVNDGVQKKGLPNVYLLSSAIVLSIAIYFQYFGI